MVKNTSDAQASDATAMPKYLTVSNVVVRLIRLWVLFGVVVLSLRVFLLAFSANPATPFVTFIYETSASYLEPFRGIFMAREVGETGYFDVSALFAIIIYLLIAWAVASLISHVELKMESAKLQAEKDRREYEDRELDSAETVKRRRS
jgi:uncharacterized protein YggT (Ycf19 family)